MKMKSVVLLAVAMGCGLVAMLGVQQALSRGKDKGTTKIPVLVAITEIAPGTLLSDSNVVFQEWPKENVPEGAVTTKEEYLERAVKTYTVAGEIIMKGKLGEKGVHGASNDIPEGMCVIAVPVNLTTSNSGLILPGDHVDVFVTYDAMERHGRVKKVKTALEHVKVFATDSVRDALGADTAEIKAKNISLLVTPEAAKVLKLAESMGTLHLALRPKDTTQAPAEVPDPDQFVAELLGQTIEPEEAPEPVTAQDEPGDLNQFLDQQEPVEEPVELAKETWTIRIYAGNEVREEVIELPEEPIAEVESIDGPNVLEDATIEEPNGNLEAPKESWYRKLKGWLGTVHSGTATASALSVTVGGPGDVEGAIDED